MDDLVKRNIAIRELERSSVYKWSVEEDQLAHNWAISIIESLPSAEAETKCVAQIEVDTEEVIRRIKKEYGYCEVVRCKECRHQNHCYQTVSHNKTHDGFNEYWAEPIEWCSKGERR